MERALVRMMSGRKRRAAGATMRCIMAAAALSPDPTAAAAGLHLAHALPCTSICLHAHKRASACPEAQGGDAQSGFLCQAGVGSPLNCT